MPEDTNFYKNRSTSDEEEDKPLSSGIEAIKEIQTSLKNVLNTVPPLKLGLMCLITILSCSVSLEIGLHSVAKRSGKISRFYCSWDGICRWASLTTSSTTGYSLFVQGVAVKTDVADLMAGVIASLLILTMSTQNNPYCFLPWLVLTLKGLAFSELPSLYAMSSAIVPSDRIAASIYLFLNCVVFVQQVCLWLDVFNIFLVVWRFRCVSGRICI